MDKDLLFVGSTRTKQRGVGKSLGNVAPKLIYSSCIEPDSSEDVWGVDECAFL
jgi:hypothetical protein